MVYRQIYTSFWTDPKVYDEFTATDKYMYLYLMTNAHTNLCGCYEISLRQISDEAGLTKDEVKKLLRRMGEFGVAHYSEETKELLLPNWHKYNWSGSAKLMKGVLAEAENIKDPWMKDVVLEAVYDRDFDR